MLLLNLSNGIFMKKFLLLLLIGFASSAHAELLDKTMAVINNEIITLSQVRRVQSNLPARIDIAPQIYQNEELTLDEVTKLLVRRLMVRKKLDEMGYVISSEQVEEQINSTQERLGLRRQDLLDFLDSNNMTFDEYFEITKQSIEFNIFFSRVIQPLISVTEQEIKNAFYNQNKNNKTLSFRYTLVDFSLHKRHMTKDLLQNFKTILERFQTSGVLPSELESLETNVLGQISEDGLNDELKKTLKDTNEGDFSEPILIGDSYKSFFVRSKDLAESEVFQEAKNRINAQLYEKKAVDAIELWYEREESNHYVRFF